MILKNEKGIYDTVQLYKSKKDAAPYLTFKEAKLSLM